MAYRAVLYMDCILQVKTGFLHTNTVVENHCNTVNESTVVVENTQINSIVHLNHMVIIL